MSRTAAAFASLIFGIIGGLGFAPVSQVGNAKTRFLPVLTTPTPVPLMGAIAAPTQTPKSTPTPKATPEEFLMGEIAIPAPTPRATPKTEKEPKIFMGKVSLRQD